MTVLFFSPPTSFFQICNIERSARPIVPLLDETASRWDRQVLLASSGHKSIRCERLNDLVGRRQPFKLSDTCHGAV